MLNKFLETVGLAFLASLMVAPTAAAQDQNAEETEYIDVDLGEREAGSVYPLVLGAENRNCEQLLDFRFSTQTSWLRLPDDPVVRQVSAGQTKQITANLDFKNVAPGQHQGFVDVDCENCGFFIFKNCKINKQQLRLLVRVNAAPAPPGVAQPPQGGPLLNPAPLPDGPLLNPLTPPQVDYKDKRIPKHLRRNAKAAHKAWALALKNSKACDDELAKLQAAADAAKEQADKAKMAADTAEQDERNAKAQKKAAQVELKNANIEAGEASDNLRKAEKALRKANRSQSSTAAEREEAKTALAKAKAAKAAADKRLNDAAQATRLHSQKDLAKLKKDAKDKRKAADRADKAAKKAQDALVKKQTECLKLKQKAAAAQEANEKAEKDANDAIPPPPAGPTDADVDTQRKKVQQCSKELGQLLEAQRLALEAMARLGALGKNHQSDLQDWADGVDAANNIFGRVPPGIPVVSEMVGTAQSALTFVRAVIGVTSGINAAGNTALVPKFGNDVVKPEATKDFIRDKVLGDHYTDDDARDAEADRVYEQMKKYSSTSPNSTKKMQEELDYKKKLCKAEEDKLDALKEAVKSK